MSRTYRVVLDWLFARIYLDSKIQVRNIDTKHQLAQTCWPKVISHVTNGAIFFICSTSAISATLAALRIPAWWAAPKRWRRGCRSKNEKKELWQKSKIYSDELVFTCSHKVLIRKSPIASNSPRILTATGKPESRMRRNSKSDAASSSQVRLQDAYFGGLMDTATVKPVATKEGVRGCGHGVKKRQWRRDP